VSTDGQTDMTKLEVAFRNSANAPINAFNFSIRRVKIGLNYASLYEYILFRLPCVCAGYSATSIPTYRFIFHYKMDLISVFLA
jgi:hypothetical protein